jgi:hypothetical protein
VEARLQGSQREELAPGRSASPKGFGAAFIENPIRQRSNHGNSDFDVRHLINTSEVWQLPFGRGKRFANTNSKVLDAIVGGWQLAQHIPLEYRIANYLAIR